MSLRRPAVVLALCLVLVPCVWGQTNPQFFPLDQIRPGLKGTGRTIFQGDKIEDFQVEFLGVLKNVLAPKHNLILARLSGGPLEKTGVIAGMSGSPVYVDGKLVGAVAISFPFSKEPLAGITPIEEMLDVVPEGKANTPPVQTAATDADFRIARESTAGGESIRLIPNQDDPEPWKKLQLATADAAPFSFMQLPLRFAGFSQQAIDLYAPLFRQMGFEPMRGGLISGSDTDARAKDDLVPGSMVSLQLVRGDLALNVDCTVTYRQGDNLYACGHRAFMTGSSKFPFGPSHVLLSVPNLASSFKIDAPGPVMGTIRQDRFSAIYGRVGDKSAPMVPVHVHVDSTLNKKVDYNFDMVQETFLTPLLLNISLISTLSATEPMIGPTTLEMKGQIKLAGGESVDVEDVLSGDFGTPNLAAAVVGTPLTYLLGSGFANLRIEGVDLNIVSTSEKRVAMLEQVWSTKSEVRPGEQIEVTAQLRLPSGETVTQKIPVTIPGSITDKMLSLVVGGGSSINALQFRFTPLGSAPKDIHQLVRALNRMRRNNRLYALLMSPQRSFFIQGDEYPSPPPSLVQTFLADPAVSSSVIFSGTSVVGDSETKPAPYTIRGQKTLFLKVVGPGI